MRHLKWSPVNARIVLTSQSTKNSCNETQLHSENCNCLKRKYFAPHIHARRKSVCIAVQILRINSNKLCEDTKKIIANEFGGGRDADKTQSIGDLWTFIGGAQIESVLKKFDKDCFKLAPLIFNLRITSIIYIFFSVSDWFINVITRVSRSFSYLQFC